MSRLIGGPKDGADLSLEAERVYVPFLKKHGKAEWLEEFYALTIWLDANGCPTIPPDMFGQAVYERQPDGTYRYVEGTK